MTLQRSSLGGRPSGECPLWSCASWMGLLWLSQGCCKGWRWGRAHCSDHPLQPQRDGGTSGAKSGTMTLKGLAGRAHFRC